MGRGSEARLTGHLTKQFIGENSLVASQNLSGSAATRTLLAATPEDVGNFTELVFFVTTTSKSAGGNLVVSVVVAIDNDGTRSFVHGTTSGNITSSTTTGFTLTSSFGRFISLSIAEPAETGSYRIEMIGKAG